MSEHRPTCALLFCPTCSHHHALSLTVPLSHFPVRCLSSRRILVSRRRHSADSLFLPGMPLTLLFTRQAAIPCVIEPPSLVLPAIAKCVLGSVIAVTALGQAVLPAQEQLRAEVTADSLCPHDLCPGRPTSKSPPVMVTLLQG